MGPDQIKAAIEALKNNDAAAALQILEEAIVAAAGGDPGDAGGEPPPSAELAEMKPIAEELKKLTKTVTLTEACGAVKAALTRLASLDNDAAALENAQRVELVAELVKLGVEFPSTAWDGEPEKRIPVERLARESLAGLKDRVAKIRAAKGGAKPPAPPAGTPPKSEKKYPPAVIKELKRLGITPEEFEERKRNAARRVGAETIESDAQ